MSIYPPIHVDLRIIPETYGVDKFVGRDGEVHAIAEKVGQHLRTNQPISQPVIHIWGTGGMGKSWLLSHLRHLYRFSAGDETKRRGTVTVLLDLGSIGLSPQRASSVANLLVDMCEQVTEQLGAEAYSTGLAPVQQAVGVVEQNPGPESIDKAVRQFVAYLEGLSKLFLPLLLLDAAESLDQDALEWLERRIIAPLARLEQVIIVIAGRKEIPRWVEFSVRQRVNVLELKPFDDTDTAKQITALGHDASRLAQIVYRLSFGLPYANQVLCRELAPLVAKHQAAADFEETHREDVIVLLGQLENELLRSVDSEVLRDILRTLGALRRFNVDSARFVMSSLLGSQYGDTGDGYFLKMFDDLQATHLVWWSPDQHGYVVSPPVRRIIDLRLEKSALISNIFFKRHEEALLYYETLLRRNLPDPAPYLVEALYHKAKLLSGQEPEEIQKEVKSLLCEYMTTQNFTTDAADHLHQQLRRDPELQNHRELLPKTGYEELLKEVETFRRNIAGAI